MTSATHHGSRRKAPQRLAVIDRDSCTGCEACIEICPVDCIELRCVGLGVKGVDVWCEVDQVRCIGCEHCVHLPRRPSNPYDSLVCPWEAIELVPVNELR